MEDLAAPTWWLLSLPESVDLAKTFGLAIRRVLPGSITALTTMSNTSSSVCSVAVGALEEAPTGSDWLQISNFTIAFIVVTRGPEAYLEAPRKVDQMLLTLIASQFFEKFGYFMWQRSVALMASYFAAAMSKLM